MATKGLWNVGGINLPDFGISEFLGIGPKNSNIFQDPNKGLNYSAPSVPPAGTTGSTPIKNILPMRSTVAPPPTTTTKSTVTTNQTPQQTITQQTPSGPSAEELARMEYENQMRNDISSGYDAYFANLDAQLAALPGQVASQEQIVNNNLGIGQNALALQEQQANQQFANQRQELETNKKKNLTALDENLRNMFMSGSVYLGAKGAGDSSAANQYSYALTKEGNKARSDQMAQATQLLSGIQQRESQLKQTIANETNRIRTEADNKKLEIGQWFADAQNQVKTAIANGQLSKSTDLANLSKEILNNAMSQLQAVQANAQNQQNSLLSWAESNSTTINELKANIQKVLDIQIPQIAQANMSGQITTDAQGNAIMKPLIGYGSTSDETKKTGLFG